MKLNIFSKTKEKKKDTKKEPKIDQPVEELVESLPEKLSAEGSNAYNVVRSIYVSEKASMLGAFNQYVFKVFADANKSEIKRKVEKLFNVKVKDVKVLNMPRKRRDIGRHPGFKPGFKKAIVVLEKGHSIGQAKA